MIETGESRATRARHWRENLLGSALRRARNWRLMAMLSIAVLLVSISGNILLGVLLYLDPPAQPDIWVLDLEGQVLWRGEPGSYEVKDLWVSGRILEWIRWVRSKRDELPVMAEDWERAKLMTVGQARQDLLAYMKTMNPERPEVQQNRWRVQVHDLKPLKRSATTYEVDWRETWTPTFGQPKTLRVSATFTVEWRPSMNLYGQPIIRQRDQNESELAIFITHYVWRETEEPRS